jgi:hypothetical protein
MNLGSSALYEPQPIPIIYQTLHRLTVSEIVPKCYAINWRTYQAWKFNSCREANAFADDQHISRGSDMGTYAFDKHLQGDQSVKMSDLVTLHNKVAAKLKFKPVNIFETRETAVAQVIWLLAKLPLSGK